MQKCYQIIPQTNSIVSLSVDVMIRWASRVDRMHVYVADQRGHRNAWSNYQVASDVKQYD